MYWLQLMDKYAANWSVLLIAICECILIAWIYGSERFLNDIQGMIGERCKCWVFFWSWMWRLVTPAALFVRFVLNFQNRLWKILIKKGLIFSLSCSLIGSNIIQHHTVHMCIPNGQM